MNYFKEYIISVITFGLLAFLCETISCHFSKDETLTRGLKFTTNLCVFTIAVMPILSIIPKLKNEIIKPENTNFQVITESEFSFSKLTEIETEKLLKEKIYNEIGILCNEINIEMNYNDNTISIKNITATTDDKSEQLRVNEYIDNLFGMTGERTTVATNENE